MMKLQLLSLIFMATSAHSGSQAKGNTGISQFWTDDFKVFDQIYGKTSDKELYGVTLPPAIMFDIPKAKSLASEKHERYIPNIDLAESTGDSYFAGDRYAKLFAKSLYNDKTKPSAALQFISFSDFKPISESNDPETYRYLKNLEEREKYKIEFPEKGIGGFKPYNAGHKGTDDEARDAYRSIQDILDAHEANKGKTKEVDDEKDLRSKQKEKRKNNDNINKSRSKVRSLNGNGINTRCNNGGCRKRNTSNSRYSRPYIKIQRIRYSKR